MISRFIDPSHRVDDRVVTYKSIKQSQRTCIIMMYYSMTSKWNLSKVGRCITRTYNSTSIQEKYLSKNDDDRGVRTLTMIDTSSKNSLSTEMIERLIDGIQEKSNDQSLRSIVINSKDKKVFSAGHNLKDLYETSQNDDESVRKGVFQLCAELMKTIIHCPVPIIAAVDGLATAAGCQLVASCDMVVATEKSTFSTPGANIGIFCSTPGVPLVRNVPAKIAARMLFTGLPITALEAYQFGLVSQIVPNDRLIEGVDQITTSIAQKSRAVIQLGKEFFHRQIYVNDISKVYEQAAQTMANNLKLQDAQEGLKSFIEKRTPKWSNKC